MHTTLKTRIDCQVLMNEHQDELTIRWKEAGFVNKSRLLLSSEILRVEEEVSEWGSSVSVSALMSYSSPALR